MSSGLTLSLLIQSSQGNTMFNNTMKIKKEGAEAAQELERQGTTVKCHTPAMFQKMAIDSNGQNCHASKKKLLIDFNAFAEYFAVRKFIPKPQLLTKASPAYVNESLPILCTLFFLHSTGQSAS
ncbi:hypothetical protein XELAEV_18033418mg [Xenopus laevis]|uniref:Uncharacterized protein n=1 Tax=Xenopus laevis TaxID=8355 RepID=A0A974CJ75_XENLA|nr:hypothetical protein XELAEV_18033418mg [Xenopus laevis]